MKGLLLHAYSQVKGIHWLIHVQVCYREATLVAESKEALEGEGQI